MKTNQTIPSRPKQSNPSIHLRTRTERVFFIVSLITILSLITLSISFLLFARHLSSPSSTSPLDGKIEISSNGTIKIGTPGGDVYVGTENVGADLIFRDSSSITGQGQHTISFGASGDTFNLNVPGVTYNYSKLQMLDQATNLIYCVWIENGEWKKVKGECEDVEDR